MPATGDQRIFLSAEATDTFGYNSEGTAGVDQAQAHHHRPKRAPPKMQGLNPVQDMRPAAEQVLMQGNTAAAAIALSHAEDLARQASMPPPYQELHAEMLEALRAFLARGGCTSPSAATAVLFAGYTLVWFNSTILWAFSQPDPDYPATPSMVTFDAALAAMGSSVHNMRVAEAGAADANTREAAAITAAATAMQAAANILRTSAARNRVPDAGAAAAAATHLQLARRHLRERMLPRAAGPAASLASSSGSSSNTIVRPRRRAAAAAAVGAAAPQQHMS